MHHTEPPAVERSLALYLALLRAYPPAFRERYGAEMALVFRDAARDAWSQSGSVGLIALLARTLADTVVNAIHERLYGNRKGLTATWWELFVGWMQREVGPVLPILPFVGAWVVYGLNRRWLPAVPPPDRGWAVLVEAIIVGVVGQTIGQIVVDRISGRPSWKGIACSVGVFICLIWGLTSRELGLVGWERALPWVALACGALANGRGGMTDKSESVSHLWMAVPALLLLLTTPAPYLSTNVFLVFVVVVNVVSAVLLRIAPRERRENVEAN